MKNTEYGEADPLPALISHLVCGRRREAAALLQPYGLDLFRLQPYADLKPDLLFMLRLAIDAVDGRARQKTLIAAGEKLALAVGGNPFRRWREACVPATRGAYYMQGIKRNLGLQGV